MYKNLRLIFGFSISALLLFVLLLATFPYPKTVFHNIGLSFMNISKQDNSHSGLSAVKVEQNKSSSLSSIDNLSDCTSKVEKVTLPAYWQGYRDNSSGNNPMDIFDKGEFPSINEFVNDQYGNLINNYLADTNMNQVDNSPIVPGAISIADFSFDINECEIQVVGNEFIVKCPEIDSMFSGASLNNHVRTNCDIDFCGENKPVFCEFPDYLPTVHSANVVSTSRCLTQDKPDYCDMSIFLKASYCRFNEENGISNTICRN